MKKAVRDCPAPRGMHGSRAVNIRKDPEIFIAGWGFVLNAGWEFLQSPLYSDFHRGVWHVVWTRLHCAVGDVIILLVAYWIAYLVSRNRSWLLDGGVLPMVVFVGVGLGYTVFSEWLNTGISGSWEYASSMPIVFGIGLSPAMQWLVVPPGILYLAHHRGRKRG